MSGWLTRPEIVVALIAAGALVVGTVLGSLLTGMMALFTQRFERTARRDEQQRERDARREEQHRDREARQKELLMKAAVDLATLRSTHGLELAKGGQRVEMIDAVNMTEVYYRQLTHLYEHGELPEDAYWDMTSEEKAALRGTSLLKSDRAE